MNPQRRTNFFYILFITVIGASIAYYVLYQAEQVSLTLEQSVVEKSTSGNSRTARIGKIGNLNVRYDNRVLLKTAQTNLLDFDTELNYALISSTGMKVVDNYFPIKFAYTKNGNPRSLSAEGYFDTYGPLNDRTAPAPDQKESLIVNGIPVFRVTYESTSYHFRSYYYNFVIVYIADGSDIYQIWGYGLPNDPSSDLTNQDVADARSYEKIFRDMLESIYFGTIEITPKE